MKRCNRRHSSPLLLAAIVVTIGMLAALVPTLEAADDGVVLPGVFTAATKTNTDPDKKVFVTCPEGKASGGGAQVFIQDLDRLPPGQQGRVSIIQVIPAQDLHGYAARAEAEAGFRFPWHLTAYVICQP